MSAVRTLRGVRRLATLPRVAHHSAVNAVVGTKLHGFTVQRVSRIDELQLTAIELTHDATAARYLHAARADANNVFSVGFRTLPPDNTGVPHILEHTTLCGSQRFPCRDPFFKMLTRSLATFMNAFTATDYTMYPFSTINATDYSNLMSVYLDAAFFPNLFEQDFLQEGWRLEHEQPGDRNSPLVFKGVVYNEMKGALSSSDAVYHLQASQELFRDGPYVNYSGGIPHHIPELTYHQLKHFHKELYHPSNAFFFSYGDLPFEQHLRQVNEDVLSKFSTQQAFKTIDRQSRWSLPRSINLLGPPETMAPDPEKTAKVSRSFMLGDVTDANESFALRMLGSLLVDGPSSVFYRALIESGLGSDYSPNTYFDGQGRETSFAVGVQGAAKDDTEKILSTIAQTFLKASQEPFDAKQVESLLHQIELSQKEESSNFGLRIISAIMPSWVHNGDVVQLMRVSDLVAEFRRKMLESPTYLQDLTKKYFVDNQHQLSVTMEPNPNYNEGQKAQEDALLGAFVSKLTESDRERIFKQGLELQEAQSKQQDLSVLPMLRVSDIEPTKRFEAPNIVTLSVPTVGPSTSQSLFPLYKFDQPTNGVSYFRAIINMNSIPDHLLPYVPLFCSVVTELGAGNLDHKELSQAIRLTTGGLSCSGLITSHHSTENLGQKALLLSSHCLNRNIDSMFDLWATIFENPHWNNVDYLAQLIKLNASHQQSSIAQSGHSYALQHAASHVSSTAKVEEILGGLTSVGLSNSLASRQSLDDVVDKLKAIAALAFTQRPIKFSINNTGSGLDDTQSSLTRFLSRVSVSARRPVSQSSPLDLTNEMIPSEPVPRKSSNVYIETPFPVNYVARCLPTVPQTHVDNAPLTILAKILSSKFLHREIREKGGAYGGGAKSRASLFEFYSYRDPNVEKTLEAFDQSIAWACNGGFSDSDIDESKLSVFQGIDSPVPPGRRGFAAFSANATAELQQTKRTQLLAVSRKQVQDVAQKYLASAAHSSTCVLGSSAHAAVAGQGWTHRPLSAFSSWSFAK
eukprot:m.576397 g.576397  ORF g.576397 m.576397 type:complete len:1026 (-) comp57899_c0_seq4:23-3100(-)